MKRTQVDTAKRSLLIPKSKKAEGILREGLKGDPKVNIHLRNGNKLLLASASGDFCLWVDLKTSSDWNLVFRSQ